MTSISQFEEMAEVCGFQRTRCVHENWDQHMVYDFPSAISDPSDSDFWRVHIDRSGLRPKVYIVGSGFTRQTVSMISAVDFMRRASESYRARMAPTVGYSLDQAVASLLVRCLAALNEEGITPHEEQPEDEAVFRAALDTVDRSTLHPRTLAELETGDGS